MAQLYLSLRCPIMITDLRTAEMIKYASNAFLATRISFINEIASICEKLGADVKEVAAGMGYDKRIGRAFLEAGLGYGGSCFPKDVKALEYMAAANGCHPQLLRAVMEINRDQRRQVVLKLRQRAGPPERQDDRRAGPVLQAQHRRHARRAVGRDHRPAAARRRDRSRPTIRWPWPTPAAICPTSPTATTPTAVADGSDALVIVTEWNEFKQLDMARIKEQHAPAGAGGRAQHLRAGGDEGARLHLSWHRQGIATQHADNRR